MTRSFVGALAIVVAGALAASGPGWAQGPRGGGDGPCRADIQKHCADAERGGGGIARCLRQHEKELSPACRDSLAARHEQMLERAEKVHAACKAEVAKHCPNHEPGEGGMIRCLRDHETDLSPQCRAALPERGRP